MATIGQLAAGVAHEINNPIGFVASNLGTLAKYTAKLADFVEAQSRVIDPAEQKAVDALKGKLRIDYVLNDIKPLIVESLEGTERVRKIVQGLKTFSRVDEAEVKPADINECLESTIRIIWNEIKYKASLRVFTAFSLLPIKRLMRRCCLIHLKNNSTCRRLLYNAAMVNAGRQCC